MRFSEFKKTLKDLTFLAEGWRGKVYVGKLNGKKVAVKVARSPDKEEAIRKEARILEMLKDYEGFPKIITKGEDFFVYEFIEGTTFGRLKPTPEEKKRILREVLEKAYLLDRLGINRDEFSNLHKNVLITPSGKVYVIDFDRATLKKNPSNVTQLLQLLKREGFITQEDAILLGRRYKKNPEGVIDEIRKLLI
ncbi:MAG: hypothetical protein GXO04_01770 [Aquificae bacterium]|nr:hypothetical protein [Aquificota bacterium]